MSKKKNLKRPFHEVILFNLTKRCLTIGMANQLSTLKKNEQLINSMVSVDREIIQEYCNVLSESIIPADVLPEVIKRLQATSEQNPEVTSLLQDVIQKLSEEVAD